MTNLSLTSLGVPVFTDDAPPDVGNASGCVTYAIACPRCAQTWLSCAHLTRAMADHRTPDKDDDDNERCPNCWAADAVGTWLAEELARLGA